MKNFLDRSIYAFSCLFTLMLVLILTIERADAQQMTSSKELAEKYFLEMNYSCAAVLFERLNAKKEKPEYVRSLALCYRHLRKYDQAEKLYARLIQLKDVKPEDHFWYGKMLQANQQFSAALAEFKVAAQNSPISHSLLDSLMKSCMKGDSLLAHPNDYQVRNIGNINTIYSEFGATTYKNGIVFASDRPLSKKELNAMDNPMTSSGLFAGTGTPFIKMYYAEINQKEPEVTLLDEHLNEEYHNGPAVFNSAETRIYFTRTRKVNRNQKNLTGGSRRVEFSESGTSDYINQLEIWFADKTEKGWSEAKPFPFNSGTNYSVGHPALSPDGKTLYFASDLPGGRGGMDLYSCALKGDSGFTKPVNLGSIINTAGDEEFPSISRKGTLYFASNGRTGLGGLDIYKSHPGIGWSLPEDLGSPMNTSKDDFAYFSTAFNDSKGYLSSNRTGARGGDDLYEFVRDIKRLLSIEVKDEHNKPVVGASMVLFDARHPNGHAQLTDKTGKTILETSAGQLSRMKASKEGFEMFEKSFEGDSIKEQNDSISIVITLIKIEDQKTEMQNSTIGTDTAQNVPGSKSYFLKNIYYTYNKSNLTQKARSELEKLCTLLKMHPDLIVEIGSYTDSRGTDQYNLELSRLRAEAVVSYLKACGIEPARLKAKGFGETHILNKCKNNVPCTQAEHQENRRTEFKIVK